MLFSLLVLIFSVQLSESAPSFLKNAHSARRQQYFWGQRESRVGNCDSFIGAKNGGLLTLSDKVRLARSEFGVSHSSYTNIRGGEQQQLTLDQKVHAAMKKLGLSPPTEDLEVEKPLSNAETNFENEQVVMQPPTPPPIPHTTAAAATSPPGVVCEDGVCQLPDQSLPHPPPRNSMEGGAVTASTTLSPPPPPTVPPPRPPPIETETINTVKESQPEGATMPTTTKTTLIPEPQQLNEDDNVVSVGDVEESKIVDDENDGDVSIEVNEEYDEDVTAVSVGDIEESEPVDDENDGNASNEVNQDYDEDNTAVSVGDIEENELVDDENDGDDSIEVNQEYDQEDIAEVEDEEESYDFDKELDKKEDTTSANSAKIDAITQQHREPDEIVKDIAKDLNVDASIAWAALGATSSTDDNNKRIYNESAARTMIELELQMIDQIPEDSVEVQQLVSEGHDPFLSRRALAFAERNMQDARAILQADKQDEEEEKAAEIEALEKAKKEKEEKQRIEDAKKKKEAEKGFKTVNVKAGFDPAALGPQTPPPTLPQPTSKGVSKENVVFEATSAQIQELVVESPVPVLLDVYADWCGPCKQLTPLLENMAVKSGGAFRLVKLNTDNERAISGVLQVTALPTVFAIRDGRIVNMFQGIPNTEEKMQNFMASLLIPGQQVKPPLTDKEKKNYLDLSASLLKVASAAAYPFSLRERLQERVSDSLELLVKEADGDVLAAEESAQIIRSLLNNAIRDPYEVKFRSINLSNKVIAAKVAKYKACMAILKGAGFKQDKTNDDKTTMTIGKGKKIINVAPLNVARDTIDKWIQQTRYEVAKAARKRKDEIESQRLKEEAAKNPQPEEVEVEVEEVDPDLCQLKVRFEGKKKVHDLDMHADDSLKKVLKKMKKIKKKKEGKPVDDEAVFQITCVAKRLVVKSTDKATMKKSLRELKLMPNAALVIADVSDSGKKSSDQTTSGKLSERAASKKKLKKGSHTMQSIGIYAKDDNAKGELIDGGGGVLFEQDVTDDEEEEEKKEQEEKAEESVAEEIQESQEADQYDESGTENANSESEYR